MEDYRPFANIKLDRYITHDIEIVIDRLRVNKENTKRLIKSIRL